MDISCQKLLAKLPISIFLFLSKGAPLNIIRFTLGITLTVGAILAFLAAFSRKRTQVQFAYHEMHALAMAVYGVSMLLFCNSFEKLISVTSLLFVFYTFSELIFCSWIFNLDQKVVVKILIVRVIIALAVGISTVVSMPYPDVSILVLGVLFTLVGINILLYVPIMKGGEINDNLKDLPV